MAGKKKTNVATKKATNPTKESKAAKAVEQPKKLSALDVSASTANASR